MPAKRELTMRQMRQVLRLRASGMSAREIGRTVGVARSTVQDGLRRAQAKGLTWPLPETLTDAVLEERLFARSGSLQGQRRRAEPDWAHLARDLKRPGVTLMILWEEYRAAIPDGYGYSRFCDELLDGEIFYSLAEAKIVIESWRRHYNTVRPHGSLGHKPPASEVFVPAMTARSAPQPGPAPPTALASKPNLN